MTMDVFDWGGLPVVVRVEISDGELIELCSGKTKAAGMAAIAAKLVEAGMPVGVLWIPHPYLNQAHAEKVEPEYGVLTRITNLALKSTTFEWRPK